eukprot:PhF_6_TR30166/c0_g1_i1/m.44230
MGGCSNSKLNIEDHETSSGTFEPQSPNEIMTTSDTNTSSSMDQDGAAASSPSSRKPQLVRASPAHPRKGGLRLRMLSSSANLQRQQKQQQQRRHTCAPAISSVKTFHDTDDNDDNTGDVGRLVPMLPP